MALIWKGAGGREGGREREGGRGREGEGGREREGGKEGGRREGGREGGREVRKCMIERIYTYILHIITCTSGTKFISYLSDETE